MTETIKGSVVLVTGATGAIAQALISPSSKARGAAKIYAAARDVSALAASDGVWCRSRWTSPATTTSPRQPRSRPTSRC